MEENVIKKLIIQFNHVFRVGLLFLNLIIVPSTIFSRDVVLAISSDFPFGSASYIFEMKAKGKRARVRYLNMQTKKVCRVILPSKLFHSSFLCVCVLR